MAVAAPVRSLLRTRWVVAACTLLALALRAPFASVALGRDEGGIAFIARQWPGGHGSLYGAYWLDRPPLLVALYKLAGLGGDLGVRALGAVAAVALVLAVWRLGRAVAEREAGRVAAVMAALLSGSFAIGAVQTPAELLAAVPSTLSVLCLVRGRLFAAGLLAASALLVKQSFLDAGVAGLAFLILSRRPRWWLEYAARSAT
jgi:4-amino-4-deoxy-L-arabinose transferase-like glycosyltransferase